MSLPDDQIQISKITLLIEIDLSCNICNIFLRLVHFQLIKSIPNYYCQDEFLVLNLARHIDDILPTLLGRAIFDLPTDLEDSREKYP